MAEPNKESDPKSNTVFSIVGKGLVLNTADDVKEFVNTIEQMDDLQVIELGGNTFGVKASKALANALKSKKSLKKALLSDIFTGRFLNEIPLALKYLCDAFEQVDLLELDLSDNAFGPAGAEPLIDFLSNTKTLQTLRLNNNGLGLGGGAMIAQALQANADKAKEENRASTLHTIVCGRNRLEDGSSVVLGRAFSCHENLKVVCMPQNGIRPDGISNIVKGLSNCKNLRHLDLQDNTFTKKGSKALADTLFNWNELEILNISDCLLSKNGAIHVFTALEKGDNKKLKELLLQFNEIQADGVEVLARAIKTHLSLLKKLELNGNRFEEEDPVVETLKNALGEWDHEEALDELDDMEEIDSDEEEEEEEEEEKSEVVEEADKAKNKEPSAKEEINEKEEDQLVEQLSKTHI